MASTPFHVFPFAIPLVVVLFASSSYSTSRLETHGDVQKTIKNGFRVGLRHVDAGANFTKLEFLQRAMKRGRHRLARLSSSNTSSDIQSPVKGGNGEYLMNLAIGTPATSFDAIMDTGSDLIWTQCKPCTKCYKQPTPIFDPEQSSSFSKQSCSSDLCNALTMSKCNKGCEYLYSYGDESTTQGFLASETLTFDQVSVPHIGFGCGNDNEGSGFTQGAGLVGLGRGPLSLVSQLGLGKFSYCLTTIDDVKSSSTSSSLLFGSLADLNTNSTQIKTTPLIQNPSQPSFYYLSLEGITVGDTLLDIPKSTFALTKGGHGGVVIDSGTTITYLEKTGFALVKKAFVSQMKLPVVDATDSTGLDLCFSLPSDVSDNIEVPKLIFHFTGADLDLPGNNYMIADSSVGLICLAMGGSSGLSIFGNVQQQNILVLHDLEKETLSFMPTKCNQL
ncbi:hypothetical protein GIB67_000775 [Kingdonia uniflora]|uniref:Peptidase A1 domain-containing protein n=1 Tax=Kingdonia uniflora TaxID=39325 RepID=A0A7J7NZV7_9MAGN|nr:hypothetical protein GIB67_000775 [Kingdonia uniflora]